MDPIWQNATLLERALQKSRELSAMGGNRTTIQRAPIAVGKEDPLMDPTAIGLGPTAGMAPQAPQYPFQRYNDSRDAHAPAVPSELIDTPPVNPGTSDRNVLDPTKPNRIAPGTEDYNEYRPEDLQDDRKPTEMQASRDVNIEPASATDIRPTGDGTIADTPISSATGVFDPFTSSLKSGAKTFFDNPASSDALLAFGAAMLQAPNFQQGLGAGAEAVRKSVQPYLQPLSLADQQKFDLLARNNMLAERAKARYNPDQPNQPSIGGYQDFYEEMPDGSTKHWNRSFVDGKPVFTDDQGNVGKPANAVRATDSRVGYTSKQDVKDEAVVRDLIPTWRSSVQKYDQLIAGYDKSGAGPGVVKSALGFLADVSGKDWFGIDLTDRQLVMQNLQDMNLIAAQGQRGLGQLTEGERVIIANALPKMSSDREAYMTVMRTLKKSAQRNLQFQSDWIAAGRPGNVKDYINRRFDELDEAERNAKGSSGSGNASDTRKPLGEIFGQ